MVGVFASLKWRLVTSRLRATKGSARVGIIIGFLVLLVFLLFIAVGLGSLRLLPEFAVPMIVTLFTVQLVAWMVTPLLAFGVDETVDPARFALLPIRAQTLQRGLLVTSLIGFFPAANVVILIGAAVALGVPWSVLPIAVICAGVQLVTCVVLSRAASTSMSGLMSSRRGRDLGMVVGLLIFLLYMVFVTVINNPGNGNALQDGTLTVAAALEWLPPGALASLPGLIASGEFAKAALAAVIALVGLALAWWWWSVALQKSLTTVPSTTAGSSPAGRGAGQHLGGRRGAWDHAGGCRPGPGAGLARPDAADAMADDGGADPGLAVPGRAGQGRGVRGGVRRHLVRGAGREPVWRRRVRAMAAPADHQRTGSAPAARCSAMLLSR